LGKCSLMNLKCSRLTEHCYRLVTDERWYNVHSFVVVFIQTQKYGWTTIWQDLNSLNQELDNAALLCVKKVTSFLGMEISVKRKGWKQVDTFLKQQGLNTEIQFLPFNGRYRTNISLHAFICLLFGGAHHLRDTDL
jgi:hypothetical protein